MTNVQFRPPITRYYNYGVTFRWVQGDNYVVVKKGYVIEGRAAIIYQDAPVKARDLPNDIVGKDQKNWVGTFPVNAGLWWDESNLRSYADKWAHNNPTLVDLSRVTKPVH